MSLKNNILLLIFTGVFLLSTANLSAAWWEQQGIPVPSGTTKVKEETRKVVGIDYEMIHYESDQSAERIKDFYRKELAGSGWTLLDPYANLAANSGEGMPKMESGYLDKAIGKNLMFENGEDILSFSFLPEGFARDEKTHFTVTKGKKPQAGSNISGNKIQLQVPELVAKPKKDVYPVYPGSSLVNLSENERTLNATYFTRDDIEDAVIFFKKEMSRYGWYLSDERPVSKASKVDSAQAKASCPSCEQQLPGLSLEVWSAELIFTNDRQDTCRLTLAQAVPPADEQYASLGMTTITVDYAEKTR
ncbi:MAG: hypothetical protein PHG40_00640 [Candidatus Omnitrophica bacterium]|nr:hypothetical protein [Candidatus Omnitrophota bacterium]